MLSIMNKPGVKAFVSFLETCKNVFRKNVYYTVEPLLSGPPLSGHPLLNSHKSKSRNFCNTNTINYPSIKRPPLLSGRGHPKSGPKCCFMSIFTSIKWPACRIYLAQHLVKRAENKSRASLLYL
jgi:hypothetical protein